MDPELDESLDLSSTIGAGSDTTRSAQGLTSSTTTIRVANDPANDIREAAGEAIAAGVSCPLPAATPQEEENPTACVFDDSPGSEETKRTASPDGDAVDRAASSKINEKYFESGMVDREVGLAGAEVNSSSSTCSRSEAAESANLDPPVSCIPSPSAAGGKGLVKLAGVAPTTTVVVQPDELVGMFPSKMKICSGSASSSPSLTAAPTQPKSGAENGTELPGVCSLNSPTAAPDSAGGKDEDIAGFELNLEKAVLLSNAGASRSPEKETAQLLSEPSEPSPERSPSRHTPDEKVYPDEGREADKTAPKTTAATGGKSTQAAALRKGRRSLAVTAMAPSPSQPARKGGRARVRQAVDQQQQQQHFYDRHQHGPYEYRNGGSVVPAEACFMDHIQALFHHQRAYQHPGNVHQDQDAMLPLLFYPPQQQHESHLPAHCSLPVQQQQGGLAAGMVLGGGPPYSGYRLPESGRAQLQLAHGDSGGGFDYHRGAVYKHHQQDHHHHQPQYFVNSHNVTNNVINNVINSGTESPTSRVIDVASAAPASQAARAVFLGNEIAAHPHPGPLHSCTPGSESHSGAAVSHGGDASGINNTSSQYVSYAGGGAESKSTVHAASECKHTVEDLDLASRRHAAVPRALAESKSSGAAGSTESKALPSESETVSAVSAEAYRGASNGNVSALEGSGHVTTTEAQGASPMFMVASIDAAGAGVACSPSLLGVERAEAVVGAGEGKGREGDVRRNNAYNDIGLVVTRTKELEKIMKDLFGASGSGLNEQLSSLGGSRRIDRRTQQRIRSIASMRNKLVHSVDATKLTVSNTFGESARRAFKSMVDDIEVTLRECAMREVEASFEQAARSADAYTLGNHPAFRGIRGTRVDGGHNEEAALAEAAAASAAAAARRERQGIVVKDTARFPHNLITAKKPAPRDPSSSLPVPNVADEAAFPDIDFAGSATGRPRRGAAALGAAAASATGGGGGRGGGAGVGAETDGERNGAGCWDGQGNIEDAQIVSGRGVCRKLGMGEVGYVATTHTMSGVYRNWDYQKRNPVGGQWKTTLPAVREDNGAGARRVVPGASPANGQVAFEGRGLDIAKKRAPKGKKASKREAARGRAALLQRQEAAALEAEEKWEEAVNARRKRAQKGERGPRSYVIRKPAAAPFWLVQGAHFGRSNCRGWYPIRQDWCARGIPECVYVTLEPSTEDRVEAMRTLPRGLTLEEDEERLMRIAIRESAAESQRAYEKKYGTEAEREARREAQALARVKAMAEREKLERDEQKQLTEVIMASLSETLGPGEKDDRDVMVAIQASKREEQTEEADPDILAAIEESRWMQETKEAMLRYQFRASVPPPATPALAETTPFWGAQNPSPSNPAGIPGASGHAQYPGPYPTKPSLGAPGAPPVQSQLSPAHVPPPRLAAPGHQAAPALAATVGIEMRGQPSQAGWVPAAPAVVPGIAMGLGMPYAGRGSLGVGLAAGGTSVEAASLPFDAAARGIQAPAAQAMIVPPAQRGAAGTGTNRVVHDGSLLAAAGRLDGGYVSSGVGTADPRATTTQGNAAVPYPQGPTSHPAVPPAASQPSTPQSVGYWAGALSGVTEGVDLGRLPPAQQANAGLPDQQQPRVRQQRSDPAGPQLAGWATVSPQLYGAAPRTTWAATDADVASTSTEKTQPVTGGAQTAAWAGGAPAAWGVSAGTGAAGAAQVSAVKGCGVEQPSVSTTERGLSVEERELQEALEASKQAEIERQQEEMEAAAAMDLALKLSAMDAPSPYAFEQYEQPALLPLGPAPPPEPPARFPPTASLATEAIPTANRETRDAMGCGTTSDPKADEEVLSSQKGDSLAAPVADARVRAHGGANDTGWSRPPPPAQPLYHTFSDHKTVQAATSTGERYPVDGGSSHQRGYAEAAMPDPEEVEDEAARELRLAMEEETRYYESDVGVPAVAACEGGSERTHAPFVDSSVSPAGAMDGNPKGHSLPEQLQPAGAAWGGEGEEGGGELARVMEQARLEQENARLLMARRREEEEEEMLARVMEESRLEQERRDQEQIDFRRAMEASLQS